MKKNFKGMTAKNTLENDKSRFILEKVIVFCHGNNNNKRTSSQHQEVPIFPLEMLAKIHWTISYHELQFQAKKYCMRFTKSKLQLRGGEGRGGSGIVAKRMYLLF
jgi:hypothetical protein